MTRPRLLLLLAPLVLGLAVAGAAGVWLVARTRGRLEEDLAVVADLLVDDLRRAAASALAARTAAEEAEVEEMARSLAALGRVLGARPPTPDELDGFRDGHGIDGLLAVEDGEVVASSGWGGPDGRRGGRGLVRRLGPLLDGSRERFVELDHRTRFGDRRATIVAVSPGPGRALVARRTRPLRDAGGALSLERALDRLAADAHVAWVEILAGDETIRRGEAGAASHVATRALPPAVAGPDVSVRLGLAPGPVERRLAVERGRAAAFGMVLLGATALIGVGLLVLAVRSERRREALRAEMERAARLATLGRLGAGLAHEIRNPLNALRLALARLRTGAGDADLGRYADVAEEEIARLDEVVRRTLAWARDEDAGPSRAVDLEDAVRRAIETEGGSEVDVDVEPARGRAAPDALDHVLRNLLRNARETGACVRVTVRPGPPPSVAVEDEGPGWPDAIRARLGEPFVTTREDGSGLGLYLARRLLERMGGRLRLEDRPGGGARAVIELETVEGGRS